MIFLKTYDRKSVKVTLSKCALSASLIFAASTVFGAPGPARSQTPHGVEKNAGKSRAVNTLPLITYFDSIHGEVYNWWAENQAQGKLALAVKGLSDVLPQDEFVDLSKENREIPARLRRTDLSLVERKMLARVFGAGLIVFGDVHISKSPVLQEGLRLKVRLEAQGERGVFTSVHRIFDLAATDLQMLQLQFGNPVAVATQDLIAQLNEKRPSHPNIELVVSGKLTQKDVNVLKRNLQYSIKDVASIREKSYENEQISFAIDYKGSNINQLRAALEKANWAEFRTQVVSHNNERIFFDVKTR